MKTDEMMQHVTPDLDPRKNADHLFMYKGVNCRQTRRVFQSLDALTAALSPDPAKTIIEVGTFHGAFTQLLRDHDISANASIHTFDITDFKKPITGIVSKYIGDVFTDQRPVVVNLISQPGRCLVFCDGGAKEREVNKFCGCLKPGDIILCHDYAKSLDVMNDKDVVGNWPPNQYESQWCNVKDALTANGCVPFMEDEMQRAMWGCFIKR